MSDYETHHDQTHDQAPEHPPVVPPRPSGFHRVNVGHLVMGTAFLGLTVVWLLVVGLDAVDLDDAHWLLPLPWLIAGAVGLGALALRGRSPDRGPAD